MQRFSALEEWEQTWLLASLQRIAAMMDAGDIDAAPVLSSGPVRATPETLGEMLLPLEEISMDEEVRESLREPP